MGSSKVANAVLELYQACHVQHIETKHIWSTAFRLNPPRCHFANTYRIFSVGVYACGFRGFDHIRWDHSDNRSSVETIIRKPDGFSCSACGSRSVTATKVGKRLILNGKIGGDAWIIEVEIHRVRCNDCSASLMERLPFLSTPKSRETKSLGRTILELRPEMSISALSQYFVIDWRTVKDIEIKNMLR